MALYQNLRNYINAVEAAADTPEQLSYLNDLYPEMVDRFNELGMLLRDRTLTVVAAATRPPHSMQSVVESDLTVDKIETEGQSLAYYQELFSQLSSNTWRSNLQTGRIQRLHYALRSISVFATAEMFDEVNPDNLLKLLDILPTDAIFRLAYIKRIPLFQGLAFDISVARRSDDYSRDRIEELRQDGYSDIDIEILSTEELQGGAKYIDFVRSDRTDVTSDNIDRLIVFSNYYRDIVLVKSWSFWRGASRIITQEQLDELNSTQKREIPGDAQITIVNRGLTI